MEKGIRTLGDGMDNALLDQNLKIGVKKILINKNSYRTILNSLRPLEITSNNMVCLVPKYVPHERKRPKFLIKKSKEPKFIPYEPYKAAVRPIVLSKETEVGQVNEKKRSKNDIEIHELVNQMSEMRRLEMDKSNPMEDESEATKLRLQWEKEKRAYEVDIKNLRESNLLLENQLKFQAQVNSELKTLLVAAVGEDLESRVQHLTEDKLALARALLNSADHLTSHQEQTEWLSGQCEVWRSKFLASSLMVEELAKWKSALSNRLNELQELTKTLLGERHKVQNLLLKTFNSLKVISEKIVDNNAGKCNVKYGNVVEVASLNEEMTENMKSHLRLTVGENLTPENFMRPTLAEKAAEKLLQNPVTISNKQDLLCKALMGVASSSGSPQMFPPSLHSCCSHCRGEIQNV